MQSCSVNIATYIFFFVSLLLCYGNDAHAKRFLDLNDGTILDTENKKVWLKNANCYGLTDFNHAYYNFNSSYPKTLASGQCGLSDGSKVGDWSLPRDELGGLRRNRSLNFSSLNSEGFLNVQPGYYWTSSSSGNYVWAENLNGYGDWISKSSTAYVWPFRPGEDRTLDSLKISPYALDFEAYDIEVDSLPQEITINNSGSTPISIESIGLTGIDTGDFKIYPGGATPCPSLSPTLAAGASCSLNAFFSPMSIGSKTAKVTIYANSKNVSVPLLGTAVYTVLGTVYDLSNGGYISNGTVAISGGSNTETNSVGKFVFPSPLLTGTYDVTISKIGYKSNIRKINFTNTQSIELYIGMIRDFDTTYLGDSKKQHLTWTNKSTTVKNIGQISITVADQFDFYLVSDTCSNNNIGTNNSCSFEIKYSPGTVGSKYALLSMPLDGSLLTAAISGNAVSTIRGTVYDLSIEPDPNYGRGTYANISITGGTTIQSNAMNGNFSFDPPPANGVYIVTVSKPGYNTVTINNVIISDTAGANLKVGLTPSGVLNIITTGSLPNAQAGISYNNDIRITGGTGPYTFTKAYGNMPPGLSIDANIGTISGTPTKTGSYTFAVGVTDSLGAYAEREYTIDVSMPLIITDPAVFPRLTHNSLYSFNLNPTGGTPPYTIALESGSIPLAPTSHHYELVTGKRGFYPARDYCANRPGGHLATITSDAERTAVAQYSYYDTIQSSSGDYVWIGLEKYLPGGGNKDYWRWVNGESSTYRWWQGVLEPSGNGYPNCAGQAKDYTGAVGWYDVNCYEIHPFLCEYEEIAFPSTDQFKGIVTPQGTSTFTIKVTDAAGRVVTKQFTMYVDAPLSITSTRLNDGIVETAFSQTLAASGGYGSYTWSVNSGTLPAGLTLNSATGVISGIPTEAVTRSIILAVQDQDGKFGYKPFTITITNPLQVLTTSLPQGHLNDAYSEQIRVTRGVAPYTYAVTGQLPTGLSLNAATGVISGTPTAAGLTNMQLTVTDSTFPVHQTKTINLSIRVSSLTTITTPALLPNGRKDVLLSAITLAANGNGDTAPYTWAVISGSLPQGVTLTPSTGIISGIPIESGDFTFTIRATDSAPTPSTADKQFYLHVSDTLQLQNVTISSGVTGAPYYQPLQATGGYPPYSWSLKSGMPPLGINLDPKTGLIAGVPISSGASSFIILATDSDNPAQTVEAIYDINVIETDKILTTSLPPATQDNAYSKTFEANGGVEPLSWSVVSGALPTGVVLDPVSGTLGGTPTACGNFPFTVQLTDSSAVPNIFKKTFNLSVTCMNGACGSDNGAILMLAPSSNLCASGVASTVTGTGPWSWMCQGIDSGSTANCSANIQTWTVTSSVPGGNGTVNCTSPVNHGANSSCAISPANGFQLSTFTDNNVDKIASISNSAYTIANVTANHSISATFSRIPINGVCGSSNSGTFTVAPSTNLCADGTASSVAGNGPWGWSCTGLYGGAAATCSANLQTWTVTSSVPGGNGTVNCTSPVNHGGNSTCTISPASGYQLSTFTDNSVNELSSISNNAYTIANVTANHSIAATFSLIPINGACGSSNGGIYTVAPTTNLCASGTPTAVTGAGPWTWTCQGANNGTNADCSAAFQTYSLGIHFTGTGQGRVDNSATSTFCDTDISTLINAGASITLSATADDYSLFGGWGGACTNSTGPCTFTMDGAKDVTATFTFDSGHAVLLGTSGYYSKILDAYGAAGSSDVIKAWGTTFAEDFTLSSGKAITLKGGFDSGYSDNSGYTLLQGILTIQSGTLTVENLVVR